MRLIKFLYLFFLVSNPFIKFYFNDVSPYLKVRDSTKVSWLKASFISKELTIDLDKDVQDIFIEFQDIRTGKVYKTDTYTLWNKERIYEDYITKVNSNLTRE